MKIIQIEEQRSKVAEHLSKAASERTKLRSIVRFFQKIRESADFELLLSYYLEFSSSLLSLIRESSLAYTDPEYLLQISELLEVYDSHLRKDIDAEEIDRCLQVVRKVLVQTWFILGEWEKGIVELMKVTGEETGVEEKQKLEESLEGQADVYEKLLMVASIFKVKYPRSYALCREILNTWDSEFRSQRSDGMNLLFTEKTGVNNVSKEESGTIVPISVKVKIRPRDAEEDIIKFNNELLPVRGELSHRLRDTIAAARSIVEVNFPRGIVDQYYTFLFSLPEKSASYLGDSWCGVIALLAYCGMVHVFYSKHLALLNGESAVTGATDMQGRLLAVDEYGLKAKITTSFFSPLKRIVVPWKNLPAATQFLESLRKKYPNRHLILESAENLVQLVEDRNLINRKRLTLSRRTISGLKLHKGKMAWALTGMFSMILLISIFFKGEIWKDRNPATYDIIEQYLIVKNLDGEELWRHDFNILMTPRYYFNPVQNVKFVNIDEDEKKEVLIGIYENSYPDVSGRMFIFDDDGTQMLEIKTGREITFGGRPYTDSYRIVFVDVVDINGDSQNEIITISHHAPDFPCCVNVWDMRGNKLNEYWHAGQLNRAYYFDLNEDGIKEIFLLGQNNEYRCAVIVVIHPFASGGISPQTEAGEYHTRDLPRAGELFYIRFPQSDIVRVMSGNDQSYDIQKKEELYQVAIANRIITNVRSFDASNILYYYFNENLILQSLTISNNYKQSYHQTTGEELNIPHTEKRLSQLLYYDGKRWVEETTMVEYWREKVGK